MRLNHISTGKLDDLGVIKQFGGGRWKIRKGRLIVACGKKERPLYIMQGKINKRETNVSQDATKELCNKQIGHISEKGLKILSIFQISRDTHLNPMKIVYQENNIECLFKDHMMQEGGRKY